MTKMIMFGIYVMIITYQALNVVMTIIYLA